MEKAKQRLHASRFHDAAQMLTPRFVNAPVGTKPEDLLKPDYWAHVVPMMRPLDSILAICEDGSWSAEYRVLQVGAVEAKIALEKGPVYFNTEYEDDDKYEVKYLSPSVRYAVRVRGTNEVVKDHLPTKEAAHEFLAEHLKRMAA